MKRKELIFADRLKFLREDRGITIYQLSNNTGIDQTTLKNYEEKIIKSPSIPNLIALCEFFGCTSDFIIGIKDRSDLSAGAIEIGKIYDSMKDYEQSWALVLMEAISEKMNSLRRQKLLNSEFLSNVLNSR